MAAARATLNTAARTPIPAPARRFRRVMPPRDCRASSSLYRSRSQSRLCRQPSTCMSFKRILHPLKIRGGLSASISTRQGAVNATHFPEDFSPPSSVQPPVVSGKSLQPLFQEKNRQGTDHRQSSSIGMKLYLLTENTNNSNIMAPTIQGREKTTRYQAIPTPQVFESPSKGNR